MIAVVLDQCSWPLPALHHWEPPVGGGSGGPPGTRMEEVRGASFAGSSPPLLGRERAAGCTVDVVVDPERPSPRCHESCLALESVEEKEKKAACGTVQ